LYDEYERRVLAFATKYGVDRRELQLPPEELISLFDSHALLALREGDLSVLRDASHRLFRGRTPDAFDSHVTNIYHEGQILKEEEGTLRERGAGDDSKEYQRYYREVNVYYPKRLKHVRNLYGKARKRLERLLPPMGRATIIVRSAYLFGGELFRDV